MLLTGSIRNAAETARNGGAMGWLRLEIVCQGIVMPLFSLSTETPPQLACRQGLLLADGVSPEKVRPQLLAVFGAAL